MDLPFGVLAVYAALAVWTGLLIVGFRRRSFGPFLWFGLLLLIALNVRYFIDGAGDSIAFFVGIYDVPDNLGLSQGDGAPALASCADNACSVWGDRYVNHPSWGVAFHERFTGGPQFRTNLLYGHIAFNTVAFVLMHVQLLRPGTTGNAVRHRQIGRVSFVALTISVACAVLLAAEHQSVTEYGGTLSMLGFWFMAACVYLCAVMGIIKIRQGDTDGHRTWMIRFAGSMWGSFWLFRVMLFVLGPILRNYEAAALLICIWFSAPLGIAIAESWRRRSRTQANARIPAPTAASTRVASPAS